MLVFLLILSISCCEARVLPENKNYWSEREATCRLYKFQPIGQQGFSPIGQTFPRTGFRECLANGSLPGGDPLSSSWLEFYQDDMLPLVLSIMFIRFTYIRSKDGRSNDKRSNDQRPKDKRSNDKRSKDKRSNWTQGRIGTQGRMTEGRMTEGRKGLKVERLDTEFERRKTEGRKSFLQFLKLY